MPRASVHQPRLIRPRSRPVFCQGTVSKRPMRTALSLQIKELQKLERIGFPVGWVAPFSENFLPFHADGAPRGPGWMSAAAFLKLIGLLATAFAVCLGAPFWFDILNKLLKLRG